MPLNRIPRLPASQETTELHDPDMPPPAHSDRWTELGHKILEWTCLISAVAMLIVIVKGWLPHG